MNKRKRIQLMVLAFSVASWAICNSVFAQAPGTRNEQKRFRITLGGGWANYDMKPTGGSYPVSDGYFWPSGIWTKSRISGGAGGFLEGGYSLWPKVTISAGVMHLLGSTEDSNYERSFLDDYNNREHPDVEFRASMTSPFVELQYVFPIKPLEIFAAIGISYIFADAYHSHVAVDSVTPPSLPWEPKDFHSRGIGYLTGIGVSYGISRTIFVNSETGYRFLRTGDLQDDGGRTWQDMNLDFSGPYMMASLSFRL